MAKCDHRTWYAVRGNGHASSSVDPAAIRRVCARCDESIPLGPSNDAPIFVVHDIRTADIIASAEENQDGRPPGRDVWAWTYRDEGLYIVDFSEYSEPNDWPWDPTRPVAGQYEEHVEMMRLAEAATGPEPFDLASAAAFVAGEAPPALLDHGERIAEQARHDVASSVARHADLETGSAESQVSIAPAEPSIVADPSPIRPFDTSERCAVVIYAEMARDPVDAIDMIAECNDRRALEVLLEMLLQPCSESIDGGLNAMLVEPVRRRLGEVKP